MHEIIIAKNKGMYLIIYIYKSQHNPMSLDGFTLMWVRVYFLNLRLG